MALSKRVVMDNLTITEYGQLQIRNATVIEDAGVEISRTFDRHVILPGEDVSNEIQLVKDIAGIVHTPEIIAAYEAKLSSA